MALCPASRRPRHEKFRGVKRLPVLEHLDRCLHMMKPAHFCGLWVKFPGLTGQESNTLKQRDPKRLVTCWWKPLNLKSCLEAHARLAFACTFDPKAHLVRHIFDIATAKASLDQRDVVDHRGRHAEQGAQEQRAAMGDLSRFWGWSLSLAEATTKQLRQRVLAQAAHEGGSGIKFN